MPDSVCGRARILFALLAVLSWSLAAPWVSAQHVAPMAIDRSFGSDGFAALPMVDPAHPGATPLGFVHLPSSGGYLFFSVQLVATKLRVVASRFTEAGALDDSWGTHGSRFYSLPVPKGATGAFVNGEDVQARVLVTKEGSPEMEVVYLVGLYDDPVTGRANLMVVRLTSDGGLLAFGAKDLSGFSEGPGSLSAVAAASAGALVSGWSGLLIAVQGKGSEVDKAALVQASASPGSVVVDIGKTTYVNDRGSGASRDFRIHHLSMDRNMAFEIVGTNHHQVMYLRFDAANPVAFSEINYFSLRCDSGIADFSVADGIVRDVGAPLGSPALLLGRMSCGASDTRAVLAKVQDISSSSVSPLWTASAGTRGSTDLLTPCPSCFAAISTSVAGQAIAVSQDDYLTRVDTADGRVLGRDALSTDTSSSKPSIRVSWKMGAWETPPYLTGLSQRNGVIGAEMGLSRIALDRLFADGMEP